MSHSNKLVDAIDAFVEDDELSVEERLDNLGKKIIANAFWLLEKNSKGLKTTPEEAEEQAEMISRFKEINGIYEIFVKKAKRSGSSKGLGEFDISLLKAIKEKRTSVGNIVVPNTNAKG